MIFFPSRCGVFALVLAAGFLSSAHAQNPPADGMAHTDPKGRHLAPRDTFYTLAYVSATTDKGVDGFPPGTEVHLVSVDKDAHTLTVTDGHANVVVSPDKLTHDMDVAGYVRAKDQANQAQVVAYQQAEAKAYQEYEKQVADYTAKDLEKRQQEERDADTRAQTQVNATANQAAQPVVAASNNNGYYDQGGYGYGSPYGYFLDSNLIPSNASGGGKGTVPSSQSTTQGGVGLRGTTSGSAGSVGGKKQ